MDLTLKFTQNKLPAHSVNETNNTDNPNGSGNVQPTGSFPGFDIPAGQFFPAEFQQLVTNAFPPLS